jgi:hypothetical protein
MPIVPWMPVRCLHFIILSVLVAAGASAAWASDVKIEPAVTVSEEYNDNVLLHPQNKVTDYITRIIPSVHMVYFAPLWDWDVAYSYEYRYYARETTREDAAQRLNLLSRTRIIKEFFFLDLKDEYSTVSLFSSQDYTQVGPLASQYLTKQNVFTANPYLVFRPTQRTELTTGYEYRNVWYAEPQAVDKSVHAMYGDLNHMHTERLKTMASARYETTDYAAQNFTHGTFLIGPRFEYQEKSYVWGRIGASRFSGYDADRATRPIWDAGIIHTTPSVTIKYETGRTWIDDAVIIIKREDRYIVSVSRDVRSQRTSLGASLAYREYGTGGYSDERKYTTAVSFSHYLTERVQGSYGVTIDQYQRFPVRSPNTTTIAYLTDVRIDYRVNETLTYSINYRYADSFSHDVYLDNYENNRIIVEVKKIF